MLTSLSFGVRAYSLDSFSGPVHTLAMFRLSAHSVPHGIGLPGEFMVGVKFPNFNYMLSKIFYRYITRFSTD